ncbi:MAG: hypothetical protein ACYTDY_02130 [Planctomycetota bacterium]|jgi:hypothetical protein
MTDLDLPVAGPPPELRQRILDRALSTPQGPAPGPARPWAARLAAALLAGAGLAPMVPPAGEAERARAEEFVRSTRALGERWLASHSGRRS